MIRFAFQKALPAVGWGWIAGTGPRETGREMQTGCGAEADPEKGAGGLPRAKGRDQTDSTRDTPGTGEPQPGAGHWWGREP